MDGLPPELPISPKTPKNPIFDPFLGGSGGGQKRPFLGGVGANFWSEGGISSFYFGGGSGRFSEYTKEGGVRGGVKNRLFRVFQTLPVANRLDL